MAKSRRRGRDEGSVFQRKNGRWVVQLEPGDGKRKFYYVKTQWDKEFKPPDSEGDEQAC